MKRLIRLLTNFKVLVASITAVLVGSALLWVQAATKGVGSTFAGGVGATLLSVGLIALVYELWLRRSVVAEYLTAAGLSTDLADAGILRVCQWGSVDWASFFEENRGDVEIAVGYGRTWSATHAAKVVRAAARDAGRITVTILDPHGPAVLLDFYGTTYGTDAAGLRGRIEEVVGTWREAANRSALGGMPVRLRIEGLTRHTPYTFYRAGKRMWVIFAPRQPGRVGDEIPSIMCEATGRAGRGLYEWVMRDIEACRRQGHARVIWESP